MGVVGIVLAEEVIQAVIVNKAVGVVDPPLLHREMILGAKALTPRPCVRHLISH